jgi:hypothetical protein
MPDIIGITLLLALLSTTVQADTLPTLDRTRSGTIFGNSGGAFDQYILQHPGGDRSITLRMTYGPLHPNAEGGIGFKVYGEKGAWVGEATKVEGQPAVLTFTLTTKFPTQYLVQVQNYYPGFQISYTLEPLGLAEARARPVSVAEAGTAARPGQLVWLAQGRLAGNRAGSFDFYEYRGEAGKSVWIKMTYEPNIPVIAPGVGFNVYRGPDRVGQGSALTNDLSTRWTNLIPREPSTYLIQVYNYIPEVQLVYRLEVTSLPAAK